MVYDLLAIGLKKVYVFRCLDLTSVHLLESHLFVVGL